MKYFILFLAAIICLSQTVQPAKILSVAFMSTKSHQITYLPLLHELAKRGHQVTMLSPFVSGKNITNYREFGTLDVDAYEKDAPNMFEIKQNGTIISPFYVFNIMDKMCRESYSLPQTKMLMEEKFDLIIAPCIFIECMGGFIHKLNTSLILVSPISAMPWVSGLMGTPTPPSFNPNVFTEYGQKMTFYQRVVSFAANTALYTLSDWYIKPKMEAIYREVLEDPNLPDSDDIIRNASIMLSNSHFSINPLRPFMPDIIEVGGMHMAPAKPLPKELEDFVQSSGEDGFILFSMGSALKGSTMPEKYRQIFLNTFGRLKQKVLWKWETEKMEGLPANVKLSKWLPQQDVLGHPKIKFFLTHGGMGSNTEAIFHGVPLLGIPMFSDQLANVKKSVQSGYALSIEFSELTEENLYETIQELLRNRTYSETIERLSNLLRDQPDKPLDRAVFWTEYVLRHKGAVHLRSSARDLNGFQYHSLDVIAFLIFLLFVVLFIIVKICKFIFKKLISFLFGSSQSKERVANGKKFN